MILEAISNRRACRTFLADPVPLELIEELIHAGQYAPTARHIKSVEYIFVTDEKTHRAIAGALVPQDFVATAPVIIVPVADTKTASKPREDLTLATANIWLQAAHLGLGCVWKHVHDGEEQEKLRAVLGIPEHYLVINVLPIGYPAETLAPHTDEEFDPKKIHREKWRRRESEY
ncbi:MAG: nitroreductase family protein [Candidatus Peribacteraceae bacterium]|jgi:nitroreductase|nr:nitroreductase family protein [Candidatus Peribacteraceae bacterium]